MFYAAARLEFLIPYSQSLKEKRSVLSRLKARIQNRFHVSVAEVDHQDLWQRAALGVALVASGPEAARNALAAVRRVVEEEPRITLLDVRSRIASIEDEP
jgi:uncharacterized protein YlxP (DUF503 family)